AAYGKSYEDLINEFVVPLGKPMITNLATGHGFYKAALPIGATVNLDSVNTRITIVEPTISVSRSL
ncbi:LD-carboxypeptidase, partial [Paenibacillus donghaensis]|nr:LD-carboxypeptidase [Paenibacillus donghaensis]